MTTLNDIADTYADQEELLPSTEIMVEVPNASDGGGAVHPIKEVKVMDPDDQGVVRVHLVI